jgi:hypothetical protein
MREAASYPERFLAMRAPDALIMAFGETAIELELRFRMEDAHNGVRKFRLSSRSAAQTARATASSICTAPTIRQKMPRPSTMFLPAQW